MANIKVSIEVESLSELVEIAPGITRITIQLYNGLGQPLNNPNVPNPISMNIDTPETTEFDVYIPVANGNYQVSNFGIAVFNPPNQCCVAQSVGNNVTITQDTAPPGQVVAKYIVKGFAPHGNIVINGTGTNRTISDTATEMPPDGYENWYFLNKKIIKLPGNLVNYPWPSNVPLGIMKARGKLGLSSFNYWGDESWQDPNAGAAFTYNTSFFFVNLFFEESGGYNPAAQVVQWMNYLPDMPTQDDKVWVMPIGPLDNYQFLQQKGVTHFSDRELNRITDPTQLAALKAAGKTYFEVPQTQTQLNVDAPDGTPDWIAPPGYPAVYPFIYNNDMFHNDPNDPEPMTTERAIAAANHLTDDHAVIIFENSEQDHAIGAQWAFWKPYYQTLTGRLTAKFGNKWRVAHNYFTGAINQYPQTGSEWDAKKAMYGSNPSVLGYASVAQHKAFSDAPVSDYPPSNLLPGNNMEDLNSCCFPIYFNSPDLVDDTEYQIMYKCDLTHGVGKYIFVFMQSFYEWKPNNLQETVFPEGKFYKYVKLPHNPAQAINYAFLSRVFADGFIPFTAASRTDGNFRYDRTWWNDSKWFPNGATSPANNDTFPYWTTSGQSEAFATSGFEDFIARGMYKYYQTYGQVHGGTDSFLEHRIKVDGVWGSWITPQNHKMFDIIDGRHQRKGIMHCRRLNSAGKAAVFYMNPYGDEKIVTVEYKLGGNTYSLDAASIMVEPKLHNVPVV